MGIRTRKIGKIAQNDFCPRALRDKLLSEARDETITIPPPRLPRRTPKKRNHQSQIELVRLRFRHHGVQNTGFTIKPQNPHHSTLRNPQEIPLNHPKNRRLHTRTRFPERTCFLPKLFPKIIHGLHGTTGMSMGHHSYPQENVCLSASKLKCRRFQSGFMVGLQWRSRSDTLRTPCPSKRRY